MTRTSRARSAPAHAARIVLLLIVFGAGLVIRLYDLTDPPLEFHPTRQLLSQLKARGMYFKDHPELPDWQRRLAIQQWQTKAQVEPEVFERLVALTYRASGVQTWVARVYASIFWMIAAAFLYLLVRRQVSDLAALVSVSYFWVFPYAVIASRSFQPDVLMVMLMSMFWWLYARWAGTEAWSWAAMAGVVGGLAIYVKFVAAFFVIGAALGLGFSRFGRDLLRKRQVWLMAALGTLPAAAYLYYGIVQHDFLRGQFSGRFIPALLLNPITYLHWAEMANLAAGALAVAAGLIGLLIASQKGFRGLLIGLWGAYLVYGLFFDYHVGTHDYYHLPLIAITALSVAPLVDLVWAPIARRVTRSWSQWLLVASFLYAVFSGAWQARSQLAAVDYRPQAARWAEIGNLLGHGPNVVALTQDYGSPLAFWGWQNAIIWPSTSDDEYRQARGGQIDFDERFNRLTLGNTYFLVTDLDELGRQPDLERRLSQFTVFGRGDGYVIYDLEAPEG